MLCISSVYVTCSLFTKLHFPHHYRLGGGAKDAEEVKTHPFFGSINFQDLYDKKVGRADYFFFSCLNVKLKELSVSS